jgi:hypothetical protein
MKLARSGQEGYPKDGLFHRLEGQALVGLGEYQAGLSKLKSFYSKWPEWWAASDIAEAYLLSSDGEKAWYWYSKAMLAKGPLDMKVGVASTMADLKRKSGEFSTALDHRLLVWSIAAQKGWVAKSAKEADKTQQLIYQARSKGIDLGEPPSKPPQLREIQTACQKHWKLALDAAGASGIKGTLIKFKPSSGQGEIEASGERYIFYRSEYPGEPTYGDSVTFEVEERSGADSQELLKVAVNIQKS